MLIFLNNFDLFIKPKINKNNNIKVEIIKGSHGLVNRDCIIKNIDDINTVTTIKITIPNIILPTFMFFYHKQNLFYFL